LIKRLAIGFAGAALCALAVPLHAGGWLIYSDLYYVGALSFLACIASFIAGVCLIKDALYYPQAPFVIGTTEAGTDFPCKLYFATEGEARRFHRDARDAGVHVVLDHRLRKWF